jgi:hypothetical protein
MSVPEGRLRIRHALLEDRAAVLDIDSNIYGGMDYLSATYKTFCEDPLRIHYILEVEGKVVSACIPP